MIEFEFSNSDLEAKHSHWKTFLTHNLITNENYKIQFSDSMPTFFDSEGRKFRIDFLGDHANYNKIKKSIHKEPLAKALASGEKGYRLLDLSAGLGVDSIFLQQLGFKVTAVERHPLVYMALKIASEHYPNIEIIYSDSVEYVKALSAGDYDVAYFDPMFPEKKKTALPKQEMVFFKNLVGSDEDASQVVQIATENKLFKRFVVKRPLSAESFKKPSGSIEGKLIRYDIYGL